MADRYLGIRGETNTRVEIVRSGEGRGRLRGRRNHYKQRSGRGEVNSSSISKRGWRRATRSAKVLKKRNASHVRSEENFKKRKRESKRNG